MLAHDAVAAVVLHKHHLIIHVGAGLIQFVYGSHSRLAADLTLDKNLFSLPFSRVFVRLLAEEKWIKTNGNKRISDVINMVQEPRHCGLSRFSQKTASHPANRRKLYE